ncbi:MAG: CBS domain-containing protein [Acidimicrobiia bacterium]|nr:CBS domain-containing protein [Acidimicrobiia bacterium]MDH5236698.1 CBS domain-containing protein [Acidimicrobiia bacterium]
MTVNIDQIMQHPVMTATPHQSIGHIRGVMAEQKISALPIVDTDGEAVGMVTASDMLADHPVDAPVSTIMSTPVFTVPRYDGPHIAARIMRNHHLHHVVVTEGKKVAGIVSAYDLLRLVEDHRFTAKPGPTPSNKRSQRS